MFSLVYEPKRQETDYQRFFSFLKREVLTKYKIKLILTGNTKHT